MSYGVNGPALPVNRIVPDVKQRNEESFARHVTEFRKELAQAELGGVTGEISLTISLKEGRVMRREIGKAAHAA